MNPHVRSLYHSLSQRVSRPLAGQDRPGCRTAAWPWAKPVHGYVPLAIIAFVIFLHGMTVARTAAGAQPGVPDVPVILPQQPVQAAGPAYSLAATDLPEFSWRGMLFSAQHGSGGGTVLFDNVYVRIDDGPMLYLTSNLSQEVGNGMWDPGLLWHQFTRDQTSYTIWATACNSAGCSELSDPFPFATVYTGFSCTEQTVPIAVTGGDRIVKVGEQVTLDASESYDPYGPDTENLIYRWACFFAPEEVTLNDTEDPAVVTFTPETEGKYRFCLNVRDQVDGAAYNRSEIAYVTITAVADPDDPDLLVANAGGPVVQAITGQEVILDGTKSTVPAGSTWQWMQINPVGKEDLAGLAMDFGAGSGAGPALSTSDYNADGVVDGSDLALLANNWGEVALSGSDEAMASFTPRLPRPYLFRLSINDGTQGKTDLVLVSAHLPAATDLATPPGVDSECLE